MGVANKVLVGFVTDGCTGGVDKYIMGLYHLLKDRIHFDFLTNCKDLRLEIQLAKDNAKLIEVSSLKHPKAQVKQVEEILRNGGYEAFYLNTSTSLNYVSMKAAYCAHVPIRICHSHSSGADAGSLLYRSLIKLLHYKDRALMVKYANRLCACSQTAAEWMYGDKTSYIQINNAFDVAKYAFDQEKRSIVRAAMNIANNTVVGFIGSLCYPKNILGALDIFAEIQKRLPDAIFMVVGDGAMENSAKEKADALGLSENVMFLGRRNDVPDLLQAMDALLAPSIFEGLSFACLEAQAAGLPCFFSANMTRETGVTPCSKFIELSRSASYWAECIIKGLEQERVNTYKYFKEKGYVLSENRKMYLEIFEKGD